MAITWNLLKEVKPADNQECWITGGGFSQIIGPYPWNSGANGFVDLWSDPEAGTIITEEHGVTHWCAAEEINVPSTGEST